MATYTFNEIKSKNKKIVSVLAKEGIIDDEKTLEDLTNELLKNYKNQNEYDIELNQINIEGSNEFMFVFIKGKVTNETILFRIPEQSKK